MKNYPCVNCGVAGRVCNQEEQDMGSMFDGEAPKAKDKSCLDGIEVKDKAYPLRGSCTPVWGQEGPEPLGVVGHCPSCGAPIYGNRVLKVNEVPVVSRSCACLPQTQNKTIQDVMQTK